MAQPTTQRFGASIFYIEDPDTAGTFVKVVGMTSGELTLDKATGSTVVPDKDDPDAAVWEQKDVTSMSWSMSFSGVSTLEAMPLIEKVALLGASVNVRLVEKGAGTGSGTPDKRYAGAAIIKFSKTWQRGERVSVKVDVEGDGELDITSAAAA
jgi:hypothetical protein